jgi:hypothetical protein
MLLEDPTCEKAKPCFERKFYVSCCKKLPDVVFGGAGLYDITSTNIVELFIYAGRLESKDR